MGVLFSIKTDRILDFEQIRTAGLEQEIENLKNKLASCTRENKNLQEELSEAYSIKVRSFQFIISSCVDFSCFR